MENSFRWTVCEVVDDGCELRKKYPSVVCQLLYNRGIRTLNEAEVFLSPEKGIIYDALLLPDIAKGAMRIYNSLLSGDKIAIYGDFDVDGITSTSIMYKGLKKIGADVITHIPHRSQEGHGLHVPFLEDLYKQGVKLVVTVDCGVTCVEEIAAFKRKMDFVITDHHLPTGPVPDAVAVIDPYLEGSQYPYKEIAGCAVAFKLLTVLYSMLGRQDEVWEFIDLVALGTVSDVMPLLDENRTLVQRGLEVLKNCKRPGINEIMRLSKTEKSSVDVEDISFYIAPRLNAAGRLDSAEKAYRLLITDDEEEAAELAEELEALNKERQRETAASCTLVADKIKGHEKENYVIITGSEEIPVGIAGLVAGKLSEKFHLPALVMHFDGENAQGSCRSIPEFDITEALGQCSEYLIHFGGHSQAAGFSIEQKNIPAFTEAMNKIAKEKLENQDLRPTLLIDAVADLKDINIDLFETVSALAPFGNSNQTPLFLTTNVRPQEVRTMGVGDKHLKFKGIQGNTSKEVIGWGYGNISEDLERPVDIVYTMKINEWRGNRTINLLIKDIAYHQSL
jgi:single-stranded-DNA-specific exonuclease